jgi:16S rRNA (guanine527-N7)-methyltransferase
MNRTGGGRPRTVGQRDNDHAGSGARATPSSTTHSVEGREREPLPTRVSGLPDLPPEYAATLDAGLATLDAGLTSDARRAIDDHVRLLLAWTAAINLTAIRDPAAAAREHVLDSLTALGPLRIRGIDELLDIGSGGGYPGLPLALGLPARRVLLVESIGKKTRFLETVVAAVGVGERVAVATARAEALATDRRHRESWQAVVARAVAPLADLVELALPLTRVGGVLVAWKRLPLDDELERARFALGALGGGPLEVVPSRVAGLEDHVLVIATKIRATPPGYPRSPTERRRRPW